MEKILLNNKWNLRILSDGEIKGEFLKPFPKEGIEAEVPGSVYGTLLKEGYIADPYYRDNEIRILPIMENDFLYETTIEITADMLAADGLLLRFDGVDTLGQLKVNGIILGTFENMHRYYEFEIRDVIKEGTNSIEVLILSPTKFIKEENALSYTGGPDECMEGFPHITKAHCMFGWDWGPRIPDAGIFKEVSILKIKHARIEQVKIQQTHFWDPKDLAYAGTKDIPPSTVTLDFSVDVELFDEDDDLNVSIMVFSPSGQLYTQIDNPYKVVITEPELWWPNGYGQQPLYNVEVAIFNYKHQLIDTWKCRIGLRTAKMNTEKDQWGECFAHEINGMKIFAMGADYIPEDNIFSRITPERTRKLLESAAWANYNCIRVWGGGYYPDDYFYDICDELGLMVWQDFMYACAAYDLTDDFEKNIEIETTQQVRRIRHHACLGILCGNNELESQVLDGAWKHSLRQKTDYTMMFEYIIPKIVEREAPDVFYWPSSPSSGGAWDAPWDENRGDAHYWDVWHGEKPFTDYRKYYYRYLSEFGFQSFPCMKTIESFTEPEDRNPFSYVMEMHQRNSSANGKILKYISGMYLYPKNFEMLLYTSQILQADAIRYGVEHFRRHRGRCNGAVVWQLNDIWPVASWSSIDYYGRFKALHYAERRMFAPLMISCEEDGELTQRPFCNAEPKPIKVGAHLHVANEYKYTIKGAVEWELRLPDSTVLEKGKFDLNVPGLDGQWFDYLDFGKYDIHEIHLSYSLFQSISKIQEGTALFTPPKHYHFIDPALTVECDNDILIVTSQAFAKGVWIEGVDGDVVLEDNFFDLEKGSRKIKILETTATQYKVCSVYDIA